MSKQDSQTKSSGHLDSRNAKTLASFVAYCNANPGLRFWQALRNWSGFPFIFAGYKQDEITFDTFNFEGRMAKHKFYQLKPVQVSVLRRLATYDQDVFTLLEPVENSSTELKDDWVLGHDMISLGLVEDIKDGLSIREKAKVVKMVPKDRNYVVLGITEVGRLMFDYCDDPACKEHKKRLPC